MSEPSQTFDGTSNLANILGYRQREDLGNNQLLILKNLEMQVTLLQRLVQLIERQTLPIDQQRMLLAKDANDAEIEKLRIAALAKQNAAIRRQEIRFNIFLTSGILLAVVGLLLVLWKKGLWPFA